MKKTAIALFASLLFLLEQGVSANKVELLPNLDRHLRYMMKKPERDDLRVVPLNMPDNRDKTSLPLRLFNVEVVNIPLRELLYTLARDADIEIDIHPEITEKVSIVAHNQTFHQILNRIVRMTSIRVKDDRSKVIVEADQAYHQRYKVDYLNVERSIVLKTQIAPSLSKFSAEAKQMTMQDNNSSSLLLEGSLSNQFWLKLKRNLCQTLLSTSSRWHQSKCNFAADKDEASDVVLYPEVGIISLYGTEKQHNAVAELLADIQTRAGRQVLIEATIVEVELNEGYESGVDWSLIINNGNSDLQMKANLLANNLSTAPFVFFSQQSPHRLQGMIKALEVFGHTKVLSSPRVIALNNQPAVLKVVNEEVYFTIEVKEELGRHKEKKQIKFESRLHTVPIGVVMNVTPQIGEAGIISLHVRPSITSIGGYKDDPAVSLSAAAQDVSVKSQVPVLQVREFDSMLSIPDQHIAILGGLIRDDQRVGNEGIPLLGKLPFLGALFRYQQQRQKKSELIIFLRPKIIHYNSDQAITEPHLVKEIPITSVKKEGSRYVSR